MKKKILISVMVIVPVIMIFLSGWIAKGMWINYQKEPLPKMKAVRQGEYRLINPLLMCGTEGNAIGEKEILPSRNGIENLIKAKTDKYRLAHVAVYFRNLNQGASFGINEEEKFAPASLLKVPLMIAWLKEAENNPQLLSKKIKYDRSIGDDNATINIRPSRAVIPGRSYSIEELIYMMIVHSDNNAKTMLFNNIDQRKLIKLYLSLGTGIPSINQPDDFMSVLEYSTFFRILFNSSYLSRDMSEKAMQYLAETEFRNGIVAGVPPNIVVAHKFGERTLGSSGEIKELHDCGIVYYPNDPYLLCIMSQGSNFSALDDIIGNISRRIYQEVDFRHRHESPFIAEPDR